MLLFFCILSIIIMLCCIILFSELNIVIDNLEITNINEIICKPNRAKLQIVFLKKMRLFSYTIKKLNIKSKIKPKLDVKNASLNLIKNVIIKNLNTEIIIDVNNAEILAYITALISTIIPNIIRKHVSNYNKEKFSYIIKPLFNNTNSYYIKLNCILSIKLVHIINAFISMLKTKKRREKNERSSNRRFNAYCNGKYKEHDRC